MAHIEDEDPGYLDSHIIEVLCEAAPDGNLAYLRSIGVSCVFAGEKEMDLPLAREKLKRLFGIETLLLGAVSLTVRSSGREPSMRSVLQLLRR